MKRRVVKQRSEIIRAAQSKLQAGFMKHRLEPKGGSKKEDFMEDYEIDNVRYVHDCDNCEFMGQYGRYDLYCCKKDDIDIGDLVLRYGNDGWEYCSLPITTIFKKEIFQVALARAIELKLITTDQLEK